MLAKRGFAASEQASRRKRSLTIEPKLYHAADLARAVRSESIVAWLSRLTGLTPFIETQCEQTGYNPRLYYCNRRLYGSAIGRNAHEAKAECGIAK